MSGIYCTKENRGDRDRHRLVFSERAPVYQYLALCVNQLIEAGKMWGGCYCVCAQVEDVSGDVLLCMCESGACFQLVEQGWAKLV
jgi:hypothetical protein